MEKSLLTQDHPDQPILQYWSQNLLRFGQEKSLSPRELEILGVMIREITQSEDIALELSISTHTVNNHLKNIFEKTKSRSKTDVLSKFFGFATRSLLSRNLPQQLIRPMSFLLVSHDLVFRENLSLELLRKGAVVYQSTPSKALNSKVAFIDCIIKPFTYFDELRIDDLLEIRNSHFLCIKLDTAKELNMNSKVNKNLAHPELLALGCLGSVSEKAPIKETLEQITTLTSIFRPSTYSLSQGQLIGPLSKKTTLGTFHLPIEAFGTHGVFVEEQYLEKQKSLPEPGDFIELEFNTPESDSIKKSLKALGIVVWNRFSDETGKRRGIGLWFLNFLESADFFAYQNFAASQNIHWLIPPGTEQFEATSTPSQKLKLPTGA